MTERPCSLYKVTHRESGKSYIGIAVDVKKRWQRHKWEALSNECDTYFARALRAYGVEAFEWKVIQKFRNSGAAKIAEKLAILWGLGHYNLTVGGDGNINPAPETRAKMSAAQQKRKTRSEATKARMSAAQKGHFVSEEAKENMRQAALRRAPASEEALANMRKAKAGTDMPHCQTSEAIEKRSAALRGKKQSPEHIAARVEGMLQDYQDNPERAKAASQRMLDRYNDPSARAEQSARIKAWWAERKAKTNKEVGP